MPGDSRSVLAALADLQFDDNGADHAIVVWHRSPRDPNAWQSLVWPMRLNEDRTDH